MDEDEILDEVGSLAVTGIEIIYEQWAKLEDEYGTQAVLNAIETFEYFMFDVDDYKMFRREREFEDVA